MPLLSVVIPAHGDPKNLTLCLRGLTQQSCTDFEVHVVNDGGTPELASVVDRHRDRLSISYDYLGPRSHRFRLARARNQGIRRARAPRVLCLDEDMVPGPRCVETHAAFGDQPVVVSGDRHHLPAPCHSRLLAVGESEFLSLVALLARWGDARGLPRGPGDRRPDMYRRLLEPGQRDARLCHGFNLSLPSKELRRVGGFWERFVGWGPEDWELVQRLVRGGCTTRIVPAAYGFHLDHPPHPSKGRRWSRLRNRWLARLSEVLPTNVRNGGPLPSFGAGA